MHVVALSCKALEKTFVIVVAKMVKFNQKDFEWPNANVDVE